MLEVKHIIKNFGATKALKDVSFKLEKGEIHALIGENGAGKSTLVKIITGVYSPDSGELFINGEKVILKSPKDSQASGISCIYQEPILVPFMTAAENIFLGREPVRNNFIDKNEMEEKSRAIVKLLNYDLDVTTPIIYLSSVDQAVINICRALVQGGKILILDEPTAALTDHEIKKLFDVLRGLRSKGVSIIYISHHLEEIMEIADRVTVMRDGEVVAVKKVEELNIANLVEAISGATLEEQYPKRRIFEPSGEALSVHNLSFDKKLRDISFELHTGEILGVFGPMGAGKTELAHCLFGLKKINNGQISICGENVSIDSPRDSIRFGIALVPENRKREGVIESLTLRDNICLPILRQIQNSLGIINSKQSSEIANKYINELKIKSKTDDLLAQNLSGGNQQRLVLAKWLASKSKILILDEPTQGVDVGAKREIYDVLRNLSEQGISVLFISSDVKEVLGVCDRVLVLRKGQIINTIDPCKYTEHEVINIAYGTEE